METDPKPSEPLRPGASPPESSPPEVSSPALSSEAEREALLGQILGEEDGAADSPPDGPAASSTDRREAMLAEVLRDTALRDTTRHSGRAPPTTTPGRLAVAAVLVIVAAWVWLAPPAFLRAAPGPAPDPARVEAGLRLAVALQAERLLAHRVEARRLPDYLREVGATLPGLDYRRIDGGTFLLRARSGPVVVEYRSDESLPDFLAPALRTLGESP